MTTPSLVSVLRVSDGTVVRGLRGRVDMPLRGTWRATLSVDGPLAVGDSVVVQYPGMSLVGTVRRSAQEATRYQVLVLAGAGNQARSLDAREYLGLAMSRALDDVARELGDPVAELPDGGLLLSRWHRPHAPAGTGLTALADEVEALAGKTASWRYTDDGRLWVGAETWPTVDLGDVQVMATDAASMIRIATDTCRARPGTTWVAPDGTARQVSSVAYVLDETSLRADLVQGVGDKTTEALRTVIEHETRHTDAHVAYAMIVVAQVGQTMTLASRHPDIPDMAAVPIHYGIPGFSATIRPGARVDVEYENGDRHTPIVTKWQTSDVTAIHLVTSGSSQPGVRGTSLATFLSELVLWANGHTHVAAGIGAPTAPAVPSLSSVPADLLSTIVSLE